MLLASEDSKLRPPELLELVAADSDRREGSALLVPAARAELTVRRASGKIEPNKMGHLKFSSLARLG